MSLPAAASRRARPSVGATTSFSPHPDSHRPYVALIRRVLGLGAETIATAMVDDQIVGLWVAGKPLGANELALLGASGLPVVR